MPAASLSFNLPEDSREHIEAVHAGEAWNTLNSIENQIHRYNRGKGSEAVTAEHMLDFVLAEVRETLRRFDP